MNKELQDLAWSVLPKEFKEEVKKEWRDACCASCAEEILEDIFGLHNLTSDAEGEEEMLYVSRKRVQELYHYHKSRGRHLAGESLINLFGSKCLPDETCNVASSDVASSEPKPAEPEFRAGDIASYVCSPTLKHKCTVTKVMQNEHSDKWKCNVVFERGDPGVWVSESDLEPYTEPNLDKESSTCTNDCPSSCPNRSRNLSQEAAKCDKQFDNILKDSFSKERRLNVAATLYAGALAHPYNVYTVDRIIELADALIAECEKADRHDKQSNQ